MGLLAGLAGSLIGAVAKPIFKKIVGGGIKRRGRRRRRKARRWLKKLRKRRAAVQINLPNGRSFTSRWKRISRKQLPINIKVARSIAIGPRRQRKNKQMGRKIRNDAADNNVDFQVGSGMGSTLLKTGVSLGSQAINSTIGKKLIDKGINSIPNIFRFSRKKKKKVEKDPQIGRSRFSGKRNAKKSQAKERRFIFGRKKVKNKKLKKILKSDVADLVINEKQKKSGKSTTIYSKRWGEFQMDKSKKRLGFRRSRSVGQFCRSFSLRLSEQVRESCRHD